MQKWEDSFLTVRGGIKKKTGFFQKNSERGLAESKISLSEKNKIFLDFFQKGGGVSLISKGCYHKKMEIFGYFRQKGGLIQFIGILS